MKIGEKTKAIISRNNIENDTLGRYADLGDWILSPANFPGPVGMVQGPSSQEDRLLTARMILRYGKRPEHGQAMVLCRSKDQSETLTISAEIDDSVIEKMRI